MNAAAARLYESRSIGALERWRGVGTQNAGEVALLRRYSQTGAPCASLRYVIRYKGVSGNPTVYVHDWCRMPDGVWKIVEPSQARP
jgi:surface antigen